MNKILFSIIFFAIAGCNTSNATWDSKKCKGYYETGTFTNGIEEFQITFKDVEATFNQLRFYCAPELGSTDKIMFDEFGTWNQSYDLNADKSRMLVWKNVDLFSNGKKYSVYTSKNPDRTGFPYTAVLVFDEADNDVLIPHNPVRDDLINYFSDIIRNHSDSKEFYKEYWTTFYPKIWELILEKNPSYK